jgi:glyoxylase-like metal-dependent hydrolase (beta-lactamase superfamily II)
MFKIGDISVYLLNDGITQADAGGPFGLVPRALYQRYYEPDAQNKIPMTLHSLLIQTDGKNILVETGLGDKLTDKMRENWGITRPQGDIIAGLARVGLTPDQIDIVINTHLHADHCAGNTTFDQNWTLHPTYPNAQYYTGRIEFDDATHPNERTASTYYPLNWDVLIEQERFYLVDDGHEVAQGVGMVLTAGHTAGHMSVIIQSNGEYALFTGDLASYAVHFERLAWMTSYDVLPLVTLESKRHWQAWALEHDALLIFPHDLKRPAGRLRRDESGKLTVETVPLEYD